MYYNSHRMGLFIFTRGYYTPNLYTYPKHASFFRIVVTAYHTCGKRTGTRALYYTTVTRHTPPRQVRSEQYNNNIRPGSSGSFVPRPLARAQIR